MQTAIVIIVIAAAALYLIRRTVKQSNGTSGCGCGCESCGQASSCSGADGLPDFRKPDSADTDHPGQ